MLKTKILPSLTLIELLVIIAVIGILATFAMPSYINAQRKAIDREAQTQLKLIQAAEGVYELETNSYGACGSNTACNTLLSIELPSGTADGGNWDYSVAVGAGFTATANGTRGTQNWSIDEDDEGAS